MWCVFVCAQACQRKRSWKASRLRMSRLLDLSAQACVPACMRAIISPAASALLLFRSRKHLASIADAAFVLTNTCLDTQTQTTHGHTGTNATHPRHAATTCACACTHTHSFSHRHACTCTDACWLTLHTLAAKRCGCDCRCSWQGAFLRTWCKT